MNLEGRAKGCLLVLACGDAVGTTLELVPHNAISEPLTDMVGGGPFNLERGQWTDDTSMAPYFADSLLDSIPSQWLDWLYRKDDIAQLAELLIAHRGGSKCGCGCGR